MGNDEIIWKDEYCIGVSLVDNAHKMLFELVSKLNRVINDTQMNREGYACYEAINFLKEYTVRHFEEEEAYMLKIKYPGYYNHKAVHDNLRFVVLPEFEDRLKKTRFSKDVVDEFAALITGWLYGHILIEDMAITGRIASRYNYVDEDAKVLLRRELERFGRDFIRIRLHLTDSKYEGRTVAGALYYEMVYKEGYIATIVADKRIIMRIAENISGRKSAAPDKLVLTEYFQIAQSVAKGAISLVAREIDDFHLISHRVFEAKELAGLFLNNLPQYSMLWNSELGEFALCILKI